ncbi:3-oxoacyl-[acyl-carrier-protein] reductase FabG-like [Spodoptera frugiperda]|uniref:3-oxoacyl-[acyl-carrier-protein] reductase FabG-like n=1 Tax=Spodoptera frugiperda TaxID=7108 RepID=A0A9R0DD01_SPOFR|nr:3-oxoacyl-[acyl-carrier-protein] reductase FabG-like [Spodoptera frugiperda]
MFANKVVLVTGGSSGIGAATVEAFAKEGASVAFVGRNEAKLKEVASRCQQHGANVLVIRADVSKDEEANTIVQQTVDKFGKLDVLVNNAGILRHATVLDPNLIDNFDEIMKTNLRPVVLITSLAIPHLIASKGNIVNVSSVLSTWIKLPGMISYSMSKAAMDHFTRGAATELASHGVRVNSVNPGPVTTDIRETSNMPTELSEDNIIEKTTALGKAADSEEVADIILYLASEKARSVTGSCYVMDNGMYLK